MADLQPIREGFRGFALRDRFIPFLGATKITPNATYPLKKGYPLILASGLGTVAAVTGTDEIQRITITGTPTGGSFTLTYTDPNSVVATTAAIAYNATAAQVQAALEALTNIGTGNVLAAGGPLPGSVVNITFQNNLSSTNVTAMTTTDSFTGGSSPASAITTPTSGVRGYITSTQILGFSDEWESGPLDGKYPRSFAQAPIELDLPFSGYVNGASAPSREIKFTPAAIGANVTFIGAVGPYTAVTQALVGTDVDLGWDVTRKEVYVRADGTVSNALARVISIPDNQVGVFGGLVEFVVLAADSYYGA